MAYSFKKYEELPESYVIFICKFDLFNARKCIYTFENRCVEDTGIALSDGARHIFVNPYGETEAIDDNLKNFLAYLRKGIATDAFTQDMEEEVVKVKNNEEWRVEYMTLEMRERERFKEGRAEGMEKGMEKGREEKLITLVLRMHSKDYTVDQIVDVTEESPERIKEILAGRN